MVLGHEHEYGSQCYVICSVAENLGPTVSAVGWSRPCVDRPILVPRIIVVAAGSTDVDGDWQLWSIAVRHDRGIRPEGRVGVVADRGGGNVHQECAHLGVGSAGRRGNSG